MKHARGWRISEFPAPATTIVLPASGHAGFVESVRDVESVRAAWRERASRERNIMFEMATSMV